MLHTISTHTSIVPDTSLGDLRAFSVWGQVVSAFTGDATELVVALAVRDLAVVVFGQEGLVACKATV